MVLVLTPEERNDRAYRRLMVLIDNIHLSADSAAQLDQVRELTDHVHRYGYMIDAAVSALGREISSVEVANEQPISPGAFDVNRHREGSRLQPGRKAEGSSRC